MANSLESNDSRLPLGCPLPIVDLEAIAKAARREIVKTVKDSKLKVQASIQGDFVRVAGRDRDTLQMAIKLLREADFGIDMQFINYRTN